MVSMFITELLTGGLSWTLEVDKVLLVDAIIVEWSWLTSDRHKVDGGLKHIDGGSMFTKLIGKAKELWFESFYDILLL